MRSRRTTSRAFTLVELLVVLGLSAIVLGGLGTLYTFTAGQTGDAMAELLSTGQATKAAADIEWTVRNAVACEIRTRNGQKALRCKMPSLEVDLNGDGLADSYRPAALNKQGLERYALGTRIWFYMADTAGTYGNAGTTMWRATRPDDSDPVAANRDLAWTYLYGRTTSPQFPLLTIFDISVDTVNRLVTFDLTAESADYADRRPTATDKAANRRTIRLQRQVFWENWRT